MSDAGRIAAFRRVASISDHFDDSARLFQQARDDQRVASVIARSNQHQVPVPTWTLIFDQYVGRAVSGQLHERRETQASRRRVGLGLSHFVRGH
jgi:hypothetical protein